MKNKLKKKNNKLKMNIINKNKILYLNKRFKHKYQ